MTSKNEGRSIRPVATSDKGKKKDDQEGAEEGEDEAVEKEKIQDEEEPQGMKQAEAEESEDTPLKVLRDPGCPTEEERENHKATHIPYRSWCLVCVVAKGKEDPHKKKA